MTVVVRPGRDADAAGFMALIEGCWAEYPGQVFDVDGEMPELRALASYYAANGGALWTADDAGAVVGMVATYPADDGWHLSRLYVQAGQRGSGLAAELLGGAEAHARAAGGRRMVLWSDVLFLRAHAFYQKHGYVRRGGIRALGDLSNSIEAGFAKPLAGLVVEALDVAAAESAEQALAAILRGCVDGGASVSFLPPLAHDAALAFWRGVTKAVGQGAAVLLAAWLGGALVGTVQLGIATPPNQPHRADLRKLLVTPSARRQGVAAALMTAAEAAAAAHGRSLLTLDTRADDAGEALYRTLGWTEAGRIPGYSIDGAGRLEATVLFYKVV